MYSKSLLPTNDNLAIKSTSWLRVYCEVLGFKEQKPITLFIPNYDLRTGYVLPRNQDENLGLTRLFCDLKVNKF